MGKTFLKFNFFPRTLEVKFGPKDAILFGELTILRMPIPQVEG